MPHTMFPLEPADIRRYPAAFVQVSLPTFVTLTDAQCVCPATSEMGTLSVTATAVIFARVAPGRAKSGSAADAMSRDIAVMRSFSLTLGVLLGALAPDGASLPRGGGL